METIEEQLKTWKDACVAKALRDAVKPPDVQVHNEVPTPVVNNHYQPPEIKVEPVFKVSPTPFEIKTPQARVDIDMTPVADAIRDIGGLLGSMIAALDKQQKLLVDLIKKLDRPAPAKRCFTIEHGDKESKLKEV